MHRRSMLWSAFSALSAVFAPAATRAEAGTEAPPPAKLKEGIHLSALHQVRFVIGHI